ncbi:MAG: hypothetical protein AAF840_00600 [Bacteroidota bacterium]
MFIGGEGAEIPFGAGYAGRYRSSGLRKPFSDYARTQVQVRD